MRMVGLCVAALLWMAATACAQANPRDPSDMLPPVYRGAGVVETGNDTHKMEQGDGRNSQGAGARRVDQAQIQRDAEELNKLAQSVTTEICQTEKGTLPKDLSGNLKRIQKLSKQLRDELKL
jgi:hypothetical protein